MNGVCVHQDDESDQVDSSDNQEGEQMDTKDKFVDLTKSLFGMKNVILLI